MISRRTLIQTLALANGAVAFSTLRAQPANAWPTKPIRLIIPSASGGAPDGLGRAIGDDMARRLGQPFVIDNKPGVNGLLAMQAMMSSPPDLHTFMYGIAASFVVNPVLLPNFRIDVQREFLPIAQITRAPYCFVVNSALGVSSLKDFIALAKNKPGQLNYASTGNGSTAHLNTLQLSKLAGIQLEHVPYKSTQPALIDLVAGRIHAFMIDYAPLAPLVSQGSVKPLAASGQHRLEGLPSLPTFAELGFNVDLVGWSGIFAPRGTPVGIVERMSSELQASTRSGRIKDYLTTTGGVAAGSSSQEFAALIEHDIKSWGNFIRSNNIKLDA
jgi:tripartite-type tricarboxylate transporter receptor subunit TctC